MIREHVNDKMVDILVIRYTDARETKQSSIYTTLGIPRSVTPSHAHDSTNT